MYLLDTNVVSELRKIRLGKAALQVAKWAETVDAAELLHLSHHGAGVGDRRAARRAPRPRAGGCVAGVAC